VQVMHRFDATWGKIKFFFIFQCFFISNSALSDHLTSKITNFVNGTSPIYVMGYDRKFYFEERSAPLFIVSEPDINQFSQINLKAFPHIKIGLFAFQDLDGNGEFSLDFKGDPKEPYGFSLNPGIDYQSVVFEDFVFDMEKFENVEIKLQLPK